MRMCVCGVDNANVFVCATYDVRVCPDFVEYVELIFIQSRGVTVRTRGNMRRGEMAEKKNLNT